MFGGDVWWCVWCTPHVAAWPQWHFAQIEMEQNRFFQPALSLSSEIHIILKNNASNMTDIDKQKNVNLRFLQNFYCLTAMVWTWCWRWCQSFLVRSGPSLVDWLVVETSFEKLCETSAWRNILRNFRLEKHLEKLPSKNILRNFLGETSWNLVWEIAWDSWEFVTLVDTLPKEWNQHIFKHWDDWSRDFGWLRVQQTGLGCAACSAAFAKRSTWSRFRACRQVTWLIRVCN